MKTNSCRLRSRGALRPLQTPNGPQKQRSRTPDAQPGPKTTELHTPEPQLAAQNNGAEVAHGHQISNRPPKKTTNCRRLSGSADQRISGGWRSHGGAEARREQREESTTRPGGQLACLVFLPVVLEPPWFPTGALHCPGHPSWLCGCINLPGRQVNAIWGRYPTACTMYVTKKLGVCWGLVDKISPAFELRNPVV
jgi:hypothetical protein